MGKYRAMFNLGLQNTVIYRWNFLFRAVSGLIPLLGGLYLWRGCCTRRARGGASKVTISARSFVISSMFCWPRI